MPFRAGGRVCRGFFFFSCFNPFRNQFFAVLSSARAACLRGAPSQPACGAIVRTNIGEAKFELKDSPRGRGRAAAAVLAGGGGSRAQRRDSRSGLRLVRRRGAPLRRRGAYYWGRGRPACRPGARRRAAGRGGIASVRWRGARRRALGCRCSGVRSRSPFVIRET